MDEKKRQVWRFVIQTAISILTAIATALGVTSCMAGEPSGLGFAARPAQHGHHKRSTAITNAARPPTNATRPKARALGRAYEEVVPTM